MQIAESNGLDNNFEGSTNDEVTFMSKKFKWVMKTKGKFQQSSTQKDARLKKKHKEESNKIIYFEHIKLGHMKAECP